MSLNSEILADVPDLYYRLNEASGNTIADSSGNGYNATAVGAPLPTLGVASLDQNDADLAIEFPGTAGTYVTRSSIAWSANSAVTIECLFYAHTLGVYADRNTDLLGAITGSEFISHLAVFSDAVEIMTGILSPVSIPCTIAINTLYHFVLARSAAGTTKIYLNGTEVASSTDAGLNDAVYFEHIAKANTPGGSEWHFDGVLDEFAIYPSELSAARVNAHADAAGLIPPEIITVTLEQTVVPPDMIAATLEQTVVQGGTVTVMLEQTVVQGGTVTATLEQTVVAVTSIIYASIKQTVFENGAITAVIEQTVVNNTGIISAAISQSVHEVGSPFSISLRQRVFSFAATADPGTAAASWAVVVTVGGVDLSSVLTGTVMVDAVEQQSKLASFTIMPALGAIDIYDWVGQTVTIDYSKDGNTDRIFTGLVDEPVYNPATALTTFNCTDGLQKQVNGLSNDQIADEIGGYYSQHIFDEKTRGWDRARERLKTLDSSYDLNVNGIGELTPWAAKATADFDYSDSQVLDKTDAITLAKRDRIHNTHNIIFQYRFQRHRVRKRSYYWHYPGRFEEWFLDATSLPTVDMVRAAVESSGWTVDRERWQHLPVSQVIRIPGQGDISWSITEELRTQMLFGGKVWAKRAWVQTVTEQYAVKVCANQSVEKLGEIAQQSQFSVESAEDTAGWADFSVTPSGVASVNIENGDEIIDVTGGEVSRTDADTALNCIQALRRTEILEAHRQNDCEFTVLLNPYIERSHTVQRSGAKITAKGKVRAYRHELNLDTAQDISSITLAISKSQATGVPTDTPIAPPAEPDKTDPLAIDPRHTVLRTHIGGKQASVEYDDTWTGYLGNASMTSVQTEYLETPDRDFDATMTFGNTYPGAPIYPVEFRVPTPAVENLLTDALEAQTAATIEVAIPEDTLTMAA